MKGDAVDPGELGCCRTDGAGWEWGGGSRVIALMKGNMFLGVTVQGVGTPEVNLPPLACSAQISLSQRNSLGVFCGVQVLPPKRSHRLGFM